MMDLHILGHFRMFSFLSVRTLLFPLRCYFQTFFSRNYFASHHLCYYFLGCPMIRLWQWAQWVLVACLNFVSFPDTASGNSVRSSVVVVSSYYKYSIRVFWGRQRREWRVSYLLQSVNCSHSSNTHRSDNEWYKERGIVHVLKSFTN